MAERPGSCRLYGPVERGPRRFYETTCALLGPAYGKPLQVLGLSNNGRNPWTCRDTAEKTSGGQDTTEKPREEFLENISRDFFVQPVLRLCSSEKTVTWKEEGTACRYIDHVIL
ncbi:hypothetical protein Taro_005160 [Colocasia esculenta]|uniref:Uncharacterized protein n=1 Tax=Colocasia esculenta TaxID=4460 RepID=A0A843TP42_COLES|nr:hypothetical protein [Colocasia esculenta]